MGGRSIPSPNLYLNPSPNPSRNPTPTPNPNPNPTYATNPTLYSQDADGIVYIVDSMDRERFPEVLRPSPSLPPDPFPLTPSSPQP